MTKHRTPNTAYVRWLADVHLAAPIAIGMRPQPTVITEGSEPRVLIVSGR